MADSPIFPIAHQGAAFGMTGRDLLKVLFKHWLTVAICFVLVTAITWSIMLGQPSIYESSGKVWVQTDQQGTPSFLSGIAAYRESQVPESVDRKIETEIQLLLSRSNVEAVIARLGITKDQLVQSPVAYFMNDLPPWLLPRKKKSPAQILNETVELFLNGMTVEPLRSKTADTTSNVLEARFACADKKLAAPALEALLQEYIHFGARHNRELGESTHRLVDSKIHDETMELNDLDDQVLNLTVQQASRADIAPMDSAVGSGRGAGDTSGVPLDTTLNSARSGLQSSLALLRTEILELQAKLDGEKQLFTDESPNVRHLQQQLDTLHARLYAGVRASAESDERLQRLDRQRALALERFNQLRVKRDQIDLYLQLNSVESDSRFVTETPVEPDKSLLKTKIRIGVLGPLAGLLLGLMLAGLSEYFDHRLQSAEDVKRYLACETLGIVPKAST
jgi:uncharacterized protein involved in exopolysaccharide biosynthesis